MAEYQGSIAWASRISAPIWWYSSPVAFSSSTQNRKNPEMTVLISLGEPGNVEFYS